mgnify:CR=1 FL=1
MGCDSRGRRVLLVYQEGVGTEPGIAWRQPTSNNLTLPPAAHQVILVECSRAVMRLPLQAPCECMCQLHSLLSRIRCGFAHADMLVFPTCRAIASGEAELAEMAAGIAEVEQQVAGLEAEAADKSSDIEGLRTEKELQAGGEVKELQEEVDKLAMK